MNKTDGRTTGQELNKKSARTQLETLVNEPIGSKIVLLDWDKNIHAKANDAGMKITVQKVVIMELNAPNETHEAMLIVKIGNV